MADTELRFWLQMNLKGFYIFSTELLQNQSELLVNNAFDFSSTFRALNEQWCWFS